MRFLSLLVLWSLSLGLFAQGSSKDKGCTAGDCQNGRGRFIYDNGDRFLGEFQNGLPNGRGNYFFQNGNVYQGTFKDGKRHGYGTFKWTTGDVYIGEYVYDQREGEGTYYFANGAAPLEGTWKAGELVKPKEAEPLAAVEPSRSKETGGEAVKIEGTEKLDLKLSAVEGEQANQKRLALVIGNSAYKNKPILPNAGRDAVSMAEALRRNGFEVRLLTDQSASGMKKAIRDFGQELKERGGVGLFYYAGHGLQAEGRNYLIPVGADIRKEQDVEFEGVDLGRVLVELEYAANALNILVLDACRDNPYKDELSKGGRHAQNGLAAIGSAPPNTFIAFSTGPGMVAQDGEGENGLYTGELVKQLGRKGLKLEDIFKEVRKAVRQASGGLQIPWELSSVEDNFIFKP